MNNVSINGNPLYINYQFDFFTFPVLVAIIPMFYQIPTVYIIFKVAKTYFKQIGKKKEELMNPHVFLSVFYMISDYITIRLPFTGILTSWCASQEPNHLLKVFFFFSVYFSYTSWIFPFVLSMLRLIPIYFPRKNNEYCLRAVKFAIPSIFLYPFLFSFTLIPAMGVCRQLLGPYQFGAIFIFFTGNWFDMKLINSLVFNLIIWLILSTVVNCILFSKLNKLKNKSKSLILQRAELSLTLTTFSMLLSFFTNLTCALIFLIFPSSTAYFIALRPFGNDCEAVFSPWTFYLTHPVFKTKKTIVVRRDVSKVGTIHTAI